MKKQISGCLVPVRLSPSLSSGPIDSSDVHVSETTSETTQNN